MSKSSEYSLFGKTPPSAAKPSQPQSTEPVAKTNDLIPASTLPSAASALADLFSAPADATQPAASANAVPEDVNIDNVSVEALEALFPSETRAEKASNASAAVAEAQAKSKQASAPANERRIKRRALISASVRVRSTDLTHTAFEDITMTINVSRIGILLASSNPAYYRSMDVIVAFPHSNAPDAIHAERPGRVVRISELPDGRRSVAIALGVTHRRDDEFIANSGEKVNSASKTPRLTDGRNPRLLRPLVLALDAEAGTRKSLTTYLEGEGYDVITVTNAQEARDVLNQCTPSILIAEIEGEGMPGYDICSHCKATPRLKSMPVMLTTSSAYPSDYASAHSLGAVVCMAKPYRQERLGNMVKLLAPPANANDGVQPRPTDPSRHHLGSTKTEKAPSSNFNSRFRLGRKS